jgi:hypothetical protein
VVLGTGAGRGFRLRVLWVCATSENTLEARQSAVIARGQLPMVTTRVTLVRGGCHGGRGRSLPQFRWQPPIYHGFRKSAEGWRIVARDQHCPAPR